MTGWLITAALAAILLWLNPLGDTMSENKKPPCIKCKSRKHVVESGDRNHYCGGCGITFNVDHEAENAAFHRDPSVAAERIDERRAKFGRRR